MTVQDLRANLIPMFREKIESREKGFQLACEFSKIGDAIAKTIGGDAESTVILHGIAVQETARTELLINQEFSLGILSLNGDCYSVREEKAAILKEIIEYLRLVQTGIVSFLECHHISGVKEGNA